MKKKQIPTADVLKNISAEVKTFTELVKKNDGSVLMFGISTGKDDIIKGFFLKQKVSEEVTAKMLSKTFPVDILAKAATISAIENSFSSACPVHGAGSKKKKATPKKKK